MKKKIMIRHDVCWESVEEGDKCEATHSLAVFKGFIRKCNKTVLGRMKTQLEYNNKRHEKKKSHKTKATIRYTKISLLPLKMLQCNTIDKMYVK